MYMGTSSPPWRNTGVDGKMGVWLVEKKSVALQLFGTPSIDMKNVSETSSTGPGVGFEMDMLNMVWPLGSMV